MAALMPDARVLETSLAFASTLDQKFDLLEQFLLARLAGKEMDSRVQQALRLLEECGGRMRVRDLACACRLSPRHLARLLSTWVGFSPKRLARIVRFQALLQHMESNPSDSAARAAPELGFFDQSHLTNEVARFAAASPTGIMMQSVSVFSKTRCQ